MSTESPFELSKEDADALSAMKDDGPETAPPEAEKPESEQAPPEREEVAPEAATEPERGEERSSTVPHQALHDERLRRKAVEKELQQAREERARFDERLRVIQEMNQRQAASEPADEMPGEDDLVGRLNWATNRLQQLEGRLTTEQQQEAQARQQHEQVQSLIRSAAVEWEQAAEARPELRDAYDHYKASRVQEFKRFGWNDPAAIEQQILREAVNYAAQARQNRIPLADLYEGLAQARGWQPKANGQDAADKIKAAAEGQARNKSLSQVGGSAAPGEMTVERLLAMSTEDFAEYSRKNPKTASRLMGA